MIIMKKINYKLKILTLKIIIMTIIVYALMLTKLKIIITKA